MSSSDRLLLILHVGFAIFALGPLTAATSATPRYIRRRDVAVLRYLHRGTRIYGLLSLGIFLFGLLLADGDFARVWLTASITLYFVALVLLLIVERDQRKAIHLLELAIAEAAPSAAVPPAAVKSAEAEAAGGKAVQAKSGAAEEGTPAAAEEPARPAVKRSAALPDDIAPVERGRIASLSGVIALIWLVILFLMVWYSR